MRKRYKLKKRSCPLCKPNKMGRENRWTPKEFSEIKEFEKTKAYYVEKFSTKSNKTENNNRGNS